MITEKTEIKWYEMEEELPPFDESILIYMERSGKGRVIGSRLMRIDSSGPWFKDVPGYYSQRIKYWAEVPEGPKSGT